MSVNATAAAEKNRRWMTWMIMVGVFFVVLMVITYKMATYTSSRASVSKSVTQVQPRSAWTKLALPPVKGGRSEHLPQMTGPNMHVRVKGSNASLHTVYMNGHEAVLPVESSDSNPDGPVDYEYVTNELDGPNTTVAYIIVPKR